MVPVKTRKTKELILWKDTSSPVKRVWYPFYLSLFHWYEVPPTRLLNESIVTGIRDRRFAYCHVCTFSLYVYPFVLRSFHPFYDSSSSGPFHSVKISPDSIFCTTLVTPVLLYTCPCTYIRLSHVLECLSFTIVIISLW